MVATRASQPRRARQVRVPQILIPTQTNGLDGVVDALARAWNGQSRDPVARAFFGPAIGGEHSDMLSESLSRYTEDVDRRLLARHLLALADAIHGVVGRWLS